MHLTVLVPARNAAGSLPDWLEDVSAFADAVIALDDGSTDTTREILEAHPLVSGVLTNPVRDTYHGWDDLENRQRLVYAALAEGASWMLFLDADERLAPDDRKALRQFLEREAQPGHAYGFEVFRMVDDFDHYDPSAFWVFRLFHADDAVTPLGSQRLHFVPVPSGIERHRWLMTTLRIQHAGSLTAEHRRARFAKYLEADPDCDHQDDYTSLLDDPAAISVWPERPAELPVLVGAEGRYVDMAGEVPGSGPAITAVVIAQDDEAVIDRSLVALTSQVLDDDVEIIVVCSGSDGTFERASSYPGVRAVQLPARALPGEARNAGLWMANGDFITFPGSHVWLLPGSLSARLAAHDAGWDLVTVSAANGNPTRPGWASYFLDHSVQTPAHESRAYTGVPGHVSYVLRDVRQVGGFPEDIRAGEDTVVNRALSLAGKRAYFCAESTFAHASPSTTVRQLVHHHFQRGRGLGRIIKGSRRRASLGQLRSNLDLPRRRLRFIHTGLDGADNELRAQFASVRSLVTLGAIAASAGCWFEMLRAAPAPAGLAAGARPPRPVIADDAPLVVVSGRPGEAAGGLLSAGTARAAAAHLDRLVGYASTVCPVRGALAPVVTSATVTAEAHGTYTLDLDEAVVDRYLAAARDAGFEFLLNIQPGRAPLQDLVTRWERLLRQPDVGILFDFRGALASACQIAELADTVAEIGERFGPTTIAVVGVDPADTPSSVLATTDVADLRRGARYPHDALGDGDRPDILVYR